MNIKKNIKWKIKTTRKFNKLRKKKQTAQEVIQSDEDPKLNIVLLGNKNSGPAGI